MRRSPRVVDRLDTFGNHSPRNMISESGSVPAFISISRFPKRGISIDLFVPRINSTGSSGRRYMMSISSRSSHSNELGTAKCIKRSPDPSKAECPSSRSLIVMPSSIPAGISMVRVYDSWMYLLPEHRGQGFLMTFPLPLHRSHVVACSTVPKIVWTRRRT